MPAATWPPAANTTSLSKSATRVPVRAPLARLRLREGALATSGDYFARKLWRGRRVNPIIDPRGGGTASFSHASVSVHTPSCLAGDALTKVFAIEGERAFARLLPMFGAEAMVLPRRGQPICSRGWVHA